jgi:sialate O-acetylesterase
MKRISFYLVVLLLIAGCSKGPSKLELPSLIGDNMVIQQKIESNFWGKAVKGTTIKVTPSWSKEVSATAGEDNRWNVTIPAPEAGGPYTIKIDASDTSITINNILSGDVWFCSGQSNMEMPMEGWPPNDTIMYSAKTIASANIPGIHLFILQKRVSGEPLDDCAGKWVVCSPETVRQFSATGFFFGKKLYEEINLPIGLLGSYWGGTPSEAWTSSDALENAGEFVSEMKAIKESAPLISEYNKWLEGHKQLDLKTTDDKWKDLDFGDKDAATPSFDDSAWPTMTLPQLFENAMGDFDGAVWFRKKIEIPGTLAGKNLTLSLGPIDDMDYTYFNGEPVGYMQMSGAWQTDRNYALPASLVRKGTNIIAVRVMDSGGGGGLYGKKGSMKVNVTGSQQAALDIEGEWKYQPVAELSGSKFYIFDVVKNDYFTQKRPVSIGPNSPASLYNAMVNPVKDYKIKGAIWYQGEANVGRADQYAKIFPLMIKNWRDTWKEGDFPFYFVQIAPYVYSAPDSTELAPLREAQTKALDLPKTGMVVTLDIATVMNIHPPFKKEVGERLADLALVNDYGKKMALNGPVYKAMTKEGRILKLQFDNVPAGLMAKNNKLTEFEIAGKDMKFMTATARIVKNEVWVESPKVSDPAYVRYCWRNSSVASLFNSEGLPAQQFMANLK